MEHASKLLEVAGLVFGIVARATGPNARTRTNDSCVRWAEFMNQHIAHKVRGDEKQFRVQRQVAFGRATGPAGALTLYE